MSEWPDRLMTTAEVAELLSVSPRWVGEAARTGILPCVRLGRNVRFRAQSIADWVDEQETLRKVGRSPRPVRGSGTK